MTEINHVSIANLAEMYATFVSAAYKKLVADGFSEGMANEIALRMLKDHIQSSVDLAAKKNQTMQDLLSGNIKGGSA